jgi:hypothetical protein
VQLLLADITSARDLGAPLKEPVDIKTKIEKGEIPGPRLYVSGPFIQHQDYLGTEAFKWGSRQSDRCKKQSESAYRCGR